LGGIGLGRFPTLPNLGIPNYSAEGIIVYIKETWLNPFNWDLKVKGSGKAFWTRGLGKGFGIILRA